MNGLSMLGDMVVAFLVGVQPGILSLFAAGLLVLAVMARKPIRIRAQNRSRESWRN
jgi:hypothetical protein